MMLMLGSIVLVVGTLYWARAVLIPIALAILLTFILSPVVSVLRRRGLPRALAVTVTVVFASMLLGAIGTMITLEFRSLANELPEYRQNIRGKISDLRLASKGGSIEKVQETVKVVMDEIYKEDSTTATNTAAVPVVVTGGKGVTQPGGPHVGPLVDQLASAGLVIVLVIFMLLRREDLRDRLLRLAGYGRLAATTKAIDEAGKRVSKYLLCQCLLNGAFGVGLGVGLFFIGLPYAFLWGFLGAVARFIPYVGPVLGAAAPMLMSLAVFTEWTAPLLIIGSVLVWELINNMILEPLIYGQGTGVSEVALLIMIAFWTWLWGPIGLVLAAPLTVCLMVISKSVPELGFINLLLSSEPALDPYHAFYQRLVAKDHDEVEDIVKTFLQKGSRLDLFEQLLIPTLITCRHDYERNRLTDQDQQYVFRVIRQMLDEPEGPARIQEDLLTGKLTPQSSEASPPADRPLILGCPANDEADELALMMLAELLRAEDWPMRILSTEMLSSETIAEVEKAQAAVVCVGFLPNGALFPLPVFCKRLRSAFPGLPIVVGCFGGKMREQALSRLSGSVQAVGWTLAETKNQLVQFGQTTPAPGNQPKETLNHPQKDSRQQVSNELLVMS